MDRSDILLVGCGGCGSTIVDNLMSIDERYEGFFFNTSSTDMNTLKNKEEEVQNYYVISTQNGVGRDKTLGRKLADRRSMSMFETLTKFHQKIIYFVTSFGGGSGGSIVESILSTISEMEANGVSLNKTINVIGVLPALSSNDKLLSNCTETWSKILAAKCVTSTIFICNDKRKSEEQINKEFVDLFDSVFDIPVDNGKLFDAGNLKNVMTTPGCTYIYDLPSDCSSVEVAFNAAKSSSVFADMYIDQSNTTFSDSTMKVNCGHVGISFSESKFDSADILKHFNNSREVYEGINPANRNIVLLSGMYPPVDYIKKITAELEDRATRRTNTLFSFSDFIVDIPEQEKPAIHHETVTNSTVQKSTLNLFKRRVK